MNDPSSSPELATSELAELRARVVQLTTTLREQSAELASLRSSHQRLEAVASAAPDYILEIDRAGRILYVNRPVPGHSTSEMLGSHVERWTQAEFHPRLQQALERVFVTGEVATYEARAATTGRIYLHRIAPLGGDATIERATLIAHDITEQTQTLERLRETEERFRTLVGSAFEGLTVSIGGVIVEANDAFAALVGSTREALIGKTALEFTTPESGRVVAERIARGSETPYEVMARRVDGSTFPAEILGRNIVYQGKPARITGFRDISARKQAEEEKRRLEQQVIQAQKLEQLGMLAGGIAHDFNNLLLVVLGHADLGLRITSSAQPVHEHLSHVRTAALRASELTKQMLTYAGRSPSRTESLDLGELVRDMTELLQVSVSKNARIRLELAAELLPVHADAGQLRQVIMNLITNASDALAGKRGEIGVRTGILFAGAAELRGVYLDATAGPGSFVFVEISDDGCGMDAATLGRIFDPFFSTKFSGRGLGLASVLGIVRSHQGAISVTSQPGQGSCFRLLFPASPDALSCDVPLRDDAAASFRASGLALVADDEPMLRGLTEEILRSVGLQVATAVNGREAVELFSSRASEVSLVVLDLTMPVMDGIAALHAIRAQRADVPVILLSGFYEQDTPALEYGERTAFLAKPFELATLLRTVHQLLAVRSHGA